MASLLAQLLGKIPVTRVYALSGTGTGSLVVKQRAAFESWRLDVELLSGDEVMLVEVDFSKKDLGVGAGLFGEIRDSVTSIIHNAWRVDFNLSLLSLETLIAGVRRPEQPTSTRHLDRFYRFYIFTYTRDPYHQPKVAVANGYSESKWVAESILLRAAKESDLKTNIDRVGQLCGDSKTGGWNEKEWVPVMLKGSQVLGATPHRVKDVSFVPVDIAASALLDMLGSDKPVLHLVHPYTVSWAVISHTASEALHIPINSYKGCVSKQHKARPLEFFEEMGEVSDVIISTDKAVQVSPTLKGIKKLERKDAEMWMAFWKKVGSSE